MNPFTHPQRLLSDWSRRLAGAGEGRPWLSLAKSVKLRWALALAIVTVTLVFACSGQDEVQDPASAKVVATRTARPTPKPTLRPTLAPTPVPTAAPTPPPPTPAPPPPPAPARAGAPAQASEPGTTAASPDSLPGTGPNYYVDDVNGNDGNSGTSETAAWRSLDRAGSFTLNPGARLLFKRGGVWAGTLKIEESGGGGLPVVIASYGSGPLPLIQGANDCIALFGSGVFITQVQAQDCWSGVRIPAGASFNRLEGNFFAGNVAGVLVSDGASDNVIAGNTLQNNNKMSVNTPGGYDDSGAFGVLLNGDRNEVAHNFISGSVSPSFDYGLDGAAVEVYGGQGNSIHHNVAVDNHAFSELGDPRSRDNTFAYNLVLSSLPDSTFLVTRGGQDGHGPVANTRLLNNTVVMTGAGSQGFVCHGGCDGGVLMMRNNIIQAALKAGYADGTFDEDYNFYAGGITQFALGPHSGTGNPVFSNPAAGDFHLAAGSPAVDSGVDAGYTADLEGRNVPRDGNADGIAVADRGAFESN
jgi:parallel beta-helix repeat protein